MIQLAPDQELGQFADFASVWRTPNTFVIDFIVVKQPAHPAQLPDGTQVPSLVEARIGSRVRIPPEQVFLLADALRTQAQQWLEEQGRSEPPESWNLGAAPTAPTGN